MGGGAAAAAGTAMASDEAAPKSAAKSTQEGLYERLVQKQEESLRKREEGQARREALELEACTFEPTINAQSQQVANPNPNLVCTHGGWRGKWCGRERDPRE